MKIRNGFVSNSSSSSFVCCICGEEYSGWDSSPSDFGGGTCVNGHEFCSCKGTKELTEEQMKGYLVATLTELIKEAKKYYAERLLEYEEDLKAIESGEAELEELMDEYNDGETPACQCPVCSFEVFAQDELVRYLVKKTGISTDSVFAELKKANKRRRKLHDFEYIEHVLKVTKLKQEDLLKEVKATYKNWEEFVESL
jgi:hypothetical protein